MSHLTITRKRLTPENADPSTQLNKIAKVGTGGFHSNAPNQSNGHSYALSQFQEFNPHRASTDPRFFIPHPPASVTSSSSVSQEEFYTLKERVTQLESQFSLLETLVDRSFNNGSQSLPPHDQQNTLTHLAALASDQAPIVTPQAQQVMPTTSAPVSSSQTQNHCYPYSTSSHDSPCSNQSRPQPPALSHPISPNPFLPLFNKLCPQPMILLFCRLRKQTLKREMNFLPKKDYKKAIEHNLKAHGGQPKGIQHTFQSWPMLPRHKRILKSN